MVALDVTGTYSGDSLKRTVTGGSEWEADLKQVIGIKVCTGYDAHRVTYGTVESLYHTPENNIALYVNWNLKKMQIKKKSQNKRKQNKT